MEITHSDLSNCDLLKISGRIDSYTSPSLQNKLENIFSCGRYNILLDLMQVTHVSSAGLRVMINAQKICREYGNGETVLLNVPPRVLEILKITGFYSIYKIFSNRSSAIEYFQHSVP